MPTTSASIDWLFLLAALAGIALTLVGSVWTAYERTMDAQESPASDRRRGLIDRGSALGQGSTVSSSGRRDRFGFGSHRAARGAVSGGDDLGHDRERGLGRRPTAEVEPDRAPQAGSAPPARPRPSSSRGVAVGLRLAAADRADVAATALERGDDGRLVELDVVGQHGDRVGRTEADLVGDLVGPADDERSASGKRSCVAKVARPSMTTVS